MLRTKRLYVVAIAVLGMVLSSCADQERELAVNTSATASVSEPAPSNRNEVSLDSKNAGFALKGGTISAAGYLLAPDDVGPKVLRDISFKIVFTDSAGEIVGSVKEYLPYCPIRTRCWWGGVYPTDQVTRKSTPVHSVKVVNAVGTPRKAAQRRVFQFPVARTEDDDVKGRAPRPEGWVYITARGPDGAKAGLGIAVSPHAGFSRRFKIDSHVFPRFWEEEHLRAFIYPSVVVHGD